MRIFDEQDVLIESPDMDKGRLIPDTRFVRHHDAVEAADEQGHWITIAEYPNGGKDVEWVIDVPRVEAKEAWDEYEDILRYIPYTEEQLAEMELAYKLSPEYRVSELESMLNALLGVSE